MRCRLQKSKVHWKAGVRSGGGLECAKRVGQLLQPLLFQPSCLPSLGPPTAAQRAGRPRGSSDFWEIPTAAPARTPLGNGQVHQLAFAFKAEWRERSARQRTRGAATICATSAGEPTQSLPNWPEPPALERQRGGASSHGAAPAFPTRPRCVLEAWFKRLTAGRIRSF